MQRDRHPTDLGPPVPNYTLIVVVEIAILIASMSLLPSTF
jgi:hypothetical protein